jgi:ABC-type Na+ efflux pump permease subunit
MKSLKSTIISLSGVVLIACVVNLSQLAVLCVPIDGEVEAFIIGDAQESPSLNYSSNNMVALASELSKAQTAHTLATNSFDLAKTSQATEVRKSIQASNNLEKKQTSTAATETQKKTTTGRTLSFTSASNESNESSDENSEEVNNSQSSEIYESSNSEEEKEESDDSSSEEEGVENVGQELFLVVEENKFNKPNRAHGFVRNEKLALEGELRREEAAFQNNQDKEDVNQVYFELEK